MLTLAFNDCCESKNKVDKWENQQAGTVNYTDSISDRAPVVGFVLHEPEFKSVYEPGPFSFTLFYFFMNYLNLRKCYQPPSRFIPNSKRPHWFGVLSMVPLYTLFCVENYYIKYCFIKILINFIKFQQKILMNNI